MSSVEEYYRKKESEWGYRWLLNGVRHLGLYDSKYTSMRQAQKNTALAIADELSGVGAVSTILDAGCGEGQTSSWVQAATNASVVGVDLLPESIDLARKKFSSNSKLHFETGNYLDLDLDNQSVSGVYTLETYIHTPDLMKPLDEFYRILKPGGKLVTFEYSFNAAKATPGQIKDISPIQTSGAMPFLSTFNIDLHRNNLAQAGFTGIECRELTDKIMPMLLRFKRWAYAPYLLMKLFGVTRRFPNTVTGRHWYDLARSGAFKVYLTVVTKE